MVKSPASTRTATPAAEPVVTRTRFSALFRRLLIWFCAANLATLIVSVVLTERIARSHAPREPDWWALAREADMVYTAHGSRALDAWIARHREENELEIALFEEGFSLSHQPLPTMIIGQIRQLLIADSLILRPQPEVVIVSLKVLDEDDVPRQFIAYRRLPRPWAPLIKSFLTLEVLFSIAAIGGVGWWLARGISRPVDAVAAAARGMAAGELSSRVDARWTQGENEMATLAQDFNTMAGRIEALVLQERSVLQDISHELRSPLARLRLNLALLQKSDPPPPHLIAADREVTRLDRLLSEVLSLARLETDLPGMARESCDLVALARQCVATLADQAARSNTPVQIEAPESLYLNGSPALLERAIENLLGNALKYAPGLPIRVVVHPAVDGLASLQVIDQGPGVPAEDIKNMFRPFFRGANAPLAEGQGLGLAIVARIARAHGGRTLAEAAPGGGLCIGLLLPAA